MEAQAIWAELRQIGDPGSESRELRHQVIGRISQTTWTAFIARNEKTRIISGRRARAEEEARYRAK